MKSSLAVLALTLAACGGGGGSGDVDAASHADAAPRPDALDPCDFHEAADAANGDVAEDTGLTLGAELRICGQIDPHAPSPTSIVDVDRYAFEVGADTPVLVRIVVPNAGALATVVGRLTAGDGSVVGGATVLGVHAAFSAKVVAGTLQVAVIATSLDTPGAAVPYQIRVAADDPVTRCPTVTAAPAYVEAYDGVDNLDNDVLTVTRAPVTLALTPAPGDVPEPSGGALTVSAGMTYGVTGVAGPTAALLDSYRDRDTFVIATGAQTDELSIRVAWTEPDADLDFLLLAPPPGVDVGPPITERTHADATGAEFGTTAVLRSSTYWLWVGAADGSAAPAPYAITLCGASFAP